MLINIKSKDVLQLIIKTYLNQLKYLSLLKYNKQLQNILNISIKDFELLNLIEIELIPINQLKNLLHITFFLMIIIQKSKKILSHLMKKLKK